MFLLIFLCTYMDICTEKVKMDTPLQIEIYAPRMNTPLTTSHIVGLDAKKRIPSFGGTL